MREKFKHLSWTLWLVIITFIVGFSMSDFFSKKDPAAAEFLVVGDEKIERSHFEQQLYMTLENYNAQFQNKLTQQTINQLRIPEQVLQNLVSSAIVHQEALKMKLTVTNEELSQQITAHPSFQQNGQFIGRDNYERLLEMRRIKVVDFENNYRKDILLDKLKQIVTAGVTIDEPALRELFTQQNDQVDLDYVALTPETVTETFSHTPMEIESHYEAHKDQYMSPERRTGRFLFLPFQALKGEVKLSDDDLFQYYRDKKEDFKTPSTRRVSRIFLPYGESDRSAVLREAQSLADALTPETFTEQAKALSKDAKAETGGDWGETEWQSLSKQEVSIAEKLTPKQISTPVDSGSGFAILFAAEATAEQYQ
jgi:peptidyl-prolyl cis-trans isomerase D